MVSLDSMLRKLEGLLDTTDLTAWEQQFLTSVLDRVGSKYDTKELSSRQVEIIESIHNKHFA